MINGPGVFDLVANFRKQKAQEAKEGKVPAIGSRVRVLAAFDPEHENLIVGRVGVVAGYFMTGAVGRVDFKGKVTREYSWAPGGKVNIQKIFPVGSWEPVAPKTPLGPKRHYKLKRKNHQRDKR